MFISTVPISISIISLAGFILLHSPIILAAYIFIVCFSLWNVSCVLILTGYILFIVSSSNYNKADK